MESYAMCVCIHTYVYMYVCLRFAAENIGGFDDLGYALLPYVPA